MLLHFWKNEYDTAFQHYSEKIKTDLEKKKKEKKNKTKVYNSREQTNSGINSHISKKKSYAKYSFTGEQSNNNTNSDHKGVGNYNFDNSKQRASMSKDVKK